MAERCTAKNRRGEQCGKPAVSGHTVCRFHGAGGNAREKVIAARVKHGRYSKYLKGAMREEYLDALLADNPYDCSDEVALGRATLADTLATGDARAIRDAVGDVVSVAKNAATAIGSLTPAEARVFVAAIMSVAYEVIERYVTDDKQRNTMFASLEIGWRTRLGSDGGNGLRAPEQERPCSIGDGNAEPDTVDAVP